LRIEAASDDDALLGRVGSQCPGGPHAHLRPNRGSGRELAAFPIRAVDRADLAIVWSERLPIRHQVYGLCNVDGTLEGETRIRKAHVLRSTDG
jgi:hypothetical protein